MTTELARRDDDMPLAQLGETFARAKWFGLDPAQVVVKVLAGRELGLGAFASVTGIHLVQGRPELSANTQAILLKRSGRYDYRVREHTEKTCSIEFFALDGGKRESLGVSTFTMQDAEKAKLNGKEVWRAFPRNMLFARALTNGVGWFCPDAFGGLRVYAEGEVGGEERAPEAPALARGEVQVLRAEIVQPPASPPREERNEAREIARPAPKAEAPKAEAPKAEAVAATRSLYSPEAGIARGLPRADALALAASSSDAKVEGWAEIKTTLAAAHPKGALKAALEAVGVKAHPKAGELRVVVMRLQPLPTAVAPSSPASPGSPAAVADVPAPVAPTRAEVLARKLGGGPRAVALGVELAAAETARSKGGHAGGFAQDAAELLLERLGPTAFDALSRAHASLWEGDHPTLGGVIAFVDAAPDAAGAPLVPATTGA